MSIDIKTHSKYCSYCDIQYGLGEEIRIFWTSPELKISNTDYLAQEPYLAESLDELSPERSEGKVVLHRSSGARSCGGLASRIIPDSCVTKVVIIEHKELQCLGLQLTSSKRPA